MATDQDRMMRFRSVLHGIGDLDRVSGAQMMFAFQQFVAIVLDGDVPPAVDEPVGYAGPAPEDVARKQAMDAGVGTHLDDPDEKAAAVDEAVRAHVDQATSSDDSPVCDPVPVEPVVHPTIAEELALEPVTGEPNDRDPAPLPPTDPAA